MGRLMRIILKGAILILSSIAGTVVGYGVFLFVSVALLEYYGDNRLSSDFVRNLVFYGIFGTTTLIGFGVGLFMVKKRRSIDEGRSA
jgi:hypothetical protein